MALGIVLMLLGLLVDRWESLLTIGSILLLSGIMVDVVPRKFERRLD